MSNENDYVIGIRKCVEVHVKKYLLAHGEGSVPSGLHSRIIKEVESALFKSILDHVDNNQVKASKILGINRNTLRKKIASDVCDKKGSV